MSGRKRALIRMNDRDRKRLQKIDDKLSAVDLDYSKIKSRIDEIESDFIGRMERDRLETEDYILNTISNLDDRILEIEGATKNTLQEQARYFYENINLTESRYNDLYDQLSHKSIESQILINQITTNFNESIKKIIDSFTELNDRIQNQQEVAFQYLSYAQVIQENLNPQGGDQSNYSNEVEHGDILISSGWSNYQNGFYQAALVQGQQAILHLNDLRFRLQESYIKHQNLKILALEKNAEVIELAKNCRYVKAIDLDGNELDVKVDVNYWTGGLLDQAIKTLERIQEHLSDPGSDLDPILLNELAIQTLPEWEVALREYVTKARLEVLSSQTRFEVANTVVNALTEQGFEVESGSYKSGDERLEYYVLLENFEGSQVQISVLPDDDDPLNYFLDINSSDFELRTETELRQRAKELLRSVESVGLRVDQVYQANDYKYDQIKELPSSKYGSRKLRNRNIT